MSGNIVIPPRGLILQSQKNPTPDWLQPPPGQSGIRRFIETLRGSLLLVVGVIIATTVAAVVFTISQDDVYEADASLLVSPVPADNLLLSGLGVIRESSDPTLDVQTAAQLITTTQVADEVAASLGTNLSPQSLLNDVRAQPVGQSNIVAILARADSAVRAQRLANAFAHGVVEHRTEQLHNRIDVILPQLRAQLTGLDNNSLAADELGNQIAELQSLRAGADPSIRLVTSATLPDSRIWPKPTLIILAGLLLGLVFGMAAAHLFRALDPRLRREEQLRETLRLPILARIPQERNAPGSQPLQPRLLSPSTHEAYRTLRATVTVPRTQEQPPLRSILVTSASPSEGKTSTSISLASTLARAGNHVILVEADLRRPAIERTLGIKADHGIANVLRGDLQLSSVLVPAPAHGGHLMILPAGRSVGETTELFSLPAGRTLIDSAGSLADYVIVDSPPLATVIDSMPLAQQVDSVIIVVRLGQTRLPRVQELAETLAGSGITPAGFVVVGVSPRREDNYYHSQRPNLPGERSSTMG